MKFGYTLFWVDFIMRLGHILYLSKGDFVADNHQRDGCCDGQSLDGFADDS
jgi:hypothetical protein